MQNINQIKRSGLLTALLSAVLVTGCGGSSDDVSETTDITVERGPVLYAHVIDATGVKGEPVVDENGQPSHQYRFQLAPVYPVTATGGYIDLDASGSLSAGDLELGQMKLQTREGNKITLASSLAEGANLEVLEQLGFSEAQLHTQTPSSDLAIAALSDEVFAYLLRNQLDDVDDVDLSALASQITTRISQYQDSDLSAIELEQALIETLQTEGLVAPVNAETVDSLLLAGNPAIIQSSFPPMTVTPAVQELITFSWDEEKMAKDLYLNLYQALDAQGVSIQSLYNVPTNSESKHQDTMRALAEKYDLDMIGFAETDGSQVVTGYDAEALAAVANAQFILPEVQAMYDDLWAHATRQGSGITAVSALEAACMVEVIDVNDLNHSIAMAEELGATELVVAFENLRSGSYNHYWAFDNALVQQGVDQGCGSLGIIDGVNFDQDYPQVSKGNTTNTAVNADMQGAGNQYGRQ